jgi:general secretion pathway protein G
MMVVIVILGILASVVTVKVYQHIRDAKVTKAKVQIREFMNAIQTYRIKMKGSEFPESLDVLTEKTDTFPDGLLAAIPKDPWGNDYDYYLDDEYKYVIKSYGADGEEGGEADDADIISYELEAEGAEDEEEESGSSGLD